MNPRLVAVINTSVDTIDVLTEILREEGGFDTAAATVTDFRDGKDSIDDFFRRYDPGAVVWDVAIPYEENWRYFAEEVRPRFPAVPFVLTTTNRAVLERLVGPTGVIELVGKPFDLDQILTAVQRAVASLEEKPSPAT
jgi:CheY-like chemotaxis protein